MAVSSWRIRKATMWETGAERSREVYFWRGRGIRERTRSRRVDGVVVAGEDMGFEGIVGGICLGLSAYRLGVVRNRRVWVCWIGLGAVCARVRLVVVNGGGWGGRETRKPRTS